MVCTNGTKPAERQCRQVAPGASHKERMGSAGGHTVGTSGTETLNRPDVDQERRWQEIEVGSWTGRRTI